MQPKDVNVKLEMIDAAMAIVESSSEEASWEELAEQIYRAMAVVAPARATLALPRRLLGV